VGAAASAPGLLGFTAPPAGDVVEQFGVIGSQPVGLLPARARHQCDLDRGWPPLHDPPDRAGTLPSTQHVDRAVAVPLGRHRPAKRSVVGSDGTDLCSERPPVPRAVRAAVMDLLAGRSTSEPTQTNDADRRERPAAVPRITSFTPLPPSRTLLLRRVGLEPCRLGLSRVERIGRRRGILGILRHCPAIVSPMLRSAAASGRRPSNW